MPDLLNSSSNESTARMAINRVRLGSAGRWVRRIFSQDRVAGAAKTLGWVAPLTFLIWIYAEREQISKRQLPIPMPITVTSADPRMVVTLLRPQDGMILVDLEGPRSQLDSLDQKFSRGGEVEAVKVVLDKLAKGPREIPTARAVRDDPLFVSRGISVTNCQPPVLQVLVDELEEREMPVAAPSSVTNLESATFEPSKIRVRAPKRAWERAPADTLMVAYADLASSAELDKPGERQLTGVRVYVPWLRDEPHVTITPNTIKVALEVRQADRQLRLPSVVVYPSGPAFLLRQNRVECPDTITNVTVVGPPDKIALLERSDYPKPWALLEVRTDDATGSTRRKRLRIMDLPKGVEPVPEDAQREVEFKIVPVAGE